MPRRHPFNRAPFWLSCLLVCGVVFVYLPLRHYDFVEFDDGLYVAGNLKVQAGLTWESVRWAFRSTEGGNWHPLTWLSHILAWEWFGPDAGTHHLTSLFFHAANSVLLFWTLRRLTGALWRSGLVAALFALHPLHVESVAWVAERKDVLSTSFFLLTVLSYTGYVQKIWNPLRPEADTKTGRALKTGGVSYTLSLVFFIFGLMSKPMLVTLPFVLLLLDYWPLKRIAGMSGWSFGRNWTRLIFEKLPFFLLSIAACGVTLWTQSKEGAVSSLTLVPFGLRLANAVVTYGRYLGKTFWPNGLAVFYPQPSEGWPASLIFGIGLALASITLLVAWARRRQPALWVGWLWYLGTLVPVIGLIQVGGQSMADRYTYIPLMGIFIMLAWGLGWIADRGQIPRNAVIILALLWVAICGGLTHEQVKLWKNSEMLFNHAVRVTENNYVAHGNLGLYFANQGRVEEAISQYRTALQIQPNCEEVHNNLGKILADQGEVEAAQYHYEEALRLDPRFAYAHNNLALLLENQGRSEEAIQHFLQSQQSQPDSPEPYSNLGALYMKLGRVDEALVQFQTALRCNPRSADVHFNLGLAVAASGDLASATKHLEQAILLRTNYAKAHYQLGIILAQQAKPAAAISHLEQALDPKLDLAGIHERLAGLYLQQGKVFLAVQHYRAALKIQPDRMTSLNNLAWILATDPDASLRNGSEAVRLAEHAVSLFDPPQPESLDTLAAALAEVGRFAEAATAAERAIQTANSMSKPALAIRIQPRLRLYQLGQAFREKLAEAP